MSIKSSRLSLPVIALGLLAGCTLGPDFTPPPPPVGASYVSGPTLPELTPVLGETRQRLVQDRVISSEWWRIFGSPTLDRLIRETLTGNPSLQAAQATLAQSRHLLDQVSGDALPQVDFGAGAQRQRGPAFALPLLPPNAPQLPLFNLYSLGPMVSYAPDVFGLVARRIEQQEALAEVAGYQWSVTRLTLTGTAVTEAFVLASARRQEELLQHIIDTDETTVKLFETRFIAGKIPRQPVLEAHAQLAHDRTLMPTLAQQRTQAANALALLVGKSPGEWSAPAFDLAEFSLPTELPLSLPSTLVRQRPDIRAAEAELHASSAAIGVATAQMYPSFPLSASLDTAALSTTSLFQQSSLVWSLAGGLSAPIFHGGSLTAAKQAAVDAFQATLAVYRQTVLQAFGQVANTLQAMDYDNQRLNAERLALDSADQSLELQQRRFKAGKIDVPALLDATRSAHQVRLDYTVAQTQRYLDSVALFVALGGGLDDTCAGCAPTPPLSTRTGGEKK